MTSSDFNQSDFNLYSTLADHGARIANLEDSERTTSTAIDNLRDSVDKLKYWIMGVLVTTLIAIGVEVLKPHDTPHEVPRFEQHLGK